MWGCVSGVFRRGCGHGRGDAIFDATGSAMVQPEAESGDVVGVTARIISVSTTLSLTGTVFDPRIRKGVSW